jgi:hypothetical protein
MTDMPERIACKSPIVPANVAARALGRHPRTVRAWVRKKVVAGVIIDGRYYVQRLALEMLIACK